MSVDDITLNDTEWVVQTGSFAAINQRQPLYTLFPSAGVLSANEEPNVNIYSPFEMGDSMLYVRPSKVNRAGSTTNYDIFTIIGAATNGMPLYDLTLNWTITGIDSAGTYALSFAHLPTQYATEIRQTYIPTSIEAIVNGEAQQCAWAVNAVPLSVFDTFDPNVDAGTYLSASITQLTIEVTEEMLGGPITISAIVHATRSNTATVTVRIFQGISVNQLEGATMSGDIRSIRDQFQKFLDTETPPIYTNITSQNEEAGNLETQLANPGINTAKGTIESALNHTPALGGESVDTSSNSSLAAMGNFLAALIGPFTTFLVLGGAFSLAKVLLRD